MELQAELKDDLNRHIFVVSTWPAVGLLLLSFYFLMRRLHRLAFFLLLPIQRDLKNSHVALFSAIFYKMPIYSSRAWLTWPSTFRSVIQSVCFSYQSTFRSVCVLLLSLPVHISLYCMSVLSISAEYIRV